MENSTSLWLNQIRRRQALMDSMMEQCGVDTLKAVRVDNGDAFFTARAKCRDCVHEDDCRRWLLEKPGSLPPNFCPNADYFRMCKRDDHSLDGHRTQNSGTVATRPHRLPDESIEQQAARGLVELIAKLHWLGEEDEANQARMQLNRITARMALWSGVPFAAHGTIGVLNDTD